MCISCRPHVDVHKGGRGPAHVDGGGGDQKPDFHVDVINGWSLSQLQCRHPHCHTICVVISSVVQLIRLIHPFMQPAYGHLSHTRGPAGLLLPHQPCTHPASHTSNHPYIQSTNLPTNHASHQYILSSFKQQ